MPGLIFALGTVAFGAVTPLPVVIGVAGPAPWTLGLPGAVAPGLPPAPRVCASAAVAISAADSIATGIKNRTDHYWLLLIFGNFPTFSSGRNHQAAGLFRTNTAWPALAEAYDVADAGK